MLISLRYPATAERKNHRNVSNKSIHRGSITQKFSLPRGKQRQAELAPGHKTMLEPGLRHRAMLNLTQAEAEILV